jgi:predicted permease
MGATRGQIVRGMIVESLMLALAGAAGGLVMAYCSVDFLKATLPDTLPRVWAIAVDARIVLVATAVAVVSGVLCGLVPALQLSTGDVIDALRHEGRSATANPRRERIRTAFLVVEVALAAILLIGAGLFVASFTRIMRVDLGFNPTNVLTVAVSNRITVGGQKDSDARVRSQTLALQVLEAVRSSPGVRSTALVAGGLPLSGSYMTHPVKIPGRAEPFEEEDEPYLRAVTSGYLTTIGATLLTGRFIEDSDTRGAPPVVVINDEAVRRYFGGRDPVGTVIDIGGPYTVVGVVRSMRVQGPETDLRPEAYVPFVQSNQSSGDLLVRTASDPLPLVSAIKASVWSVLPNAVISEAETFDSLYAELIAARKFNVILLGIFGTLAVLIASIGIYGVMSYVVEQRTREIGVRMALGAMPRRIVVMILGRASLTTALGLAIGFGVAMWLERLVTSFLFNPTPRDPAVYASTAVAIMLVALLAVYLPARRAARVDPLVALRSE